MFLNINPFGFTKTPLLLHFTPTPNWQPGRVTTLLWEKGVKIQMTCLGSGCFLLLPELLDRHVLLTVFLHHLCYSHFEVFLSYMYPPLS